MFDQILFAVIMGLGTLWVIVGEEQKKKRREEDDD